MEAIKKQFDEWYLSLSDDDFVDPRIKTRLQTIHEGNTVFSCKGSPLEKIISGVVKNKPVPNDDVLELVIEGNYVLE